MSVQISPTRFREFDLTDSSLTLNSCVVASQELISCTLADEVVLLSLQTGEYYGLNAVAASIWELIQKPCSITDVRDGLLLEYEGISPDECARQVLALVSDMLHLQLIKIC